MVFLKQMLDKIGFRELIHSCEYLPSQNSNRAYGIDVILESFITSIWCGANRFLHTEITRSDRALGKIFDWKQTPAQDAYKRYFGKFNQSTNQEVGHHFFKWFFKNLQINYFTLDIDSSVITRYGEQEGAKKGNNPKKKGRNSHHPIIAFVNDVRMVANFWLRSGNTSSANNFVGFLEETLANFGDKKVGLVRLDSGFFQKNIMDYLEAKGDELWKDNPHKKCQKDTDARWTKKNNETFYAYKTHNKIDGKSKFVKSTLLPAPKFMIHSQLPT